MLVPEPSTSLPTQSSFSILMGVVEVARILRVSRGPPTWISTLNGTPQAWTCSDQQPGRDRAAP